MNFLHTCPRWLHIGRKYRTLFRSDHLVISGRDELEQLSRFFFAHRFTLCITRLTITLAPTYQYSHFPGSWRNSQGYDLSLMAVMEQIRWDLTALRKDLFEKFWIHREWTTSTLHHFSLYVSFSAVSSRRQLLEQWTRHWISHIEAQWRWLQWTGIWGLYGDGLYSCWDR